jgi:hypothetical protein
VLALPCLTAICLCLALPATSGAVVTLGSDLSKPPISSWGCGGMPCTGVQVSLPGRVTVSPVNGTVTTFRIRGSSGPADIGRLRVVSPMGVPSLFRSSSANVTVPAGTSVSTFTTSLSISAGDRIGLDDDHTGGSNFGDAGGSGGPEEIFQPIPGDGTMRNPDFTGDGELLFNADVVPTAIFPTPSKPKSLKSGGALLTIAAPNPGLLTVASSNAKAAAASGKKGLFVKAVSLTVAAAGDVQVKLRPTKSTKSILRRFGQANGQVTITFTPTGGTPTSQTLRLRLRRP